MRSLIAVVLIAMFVAFVWASAASAAIYYVDAVSGSDSNPGTIAEPWQTITKVKATFAAGDSIYFREGTYTGRLDAGATGTLESSVTFAAYNGEEVIWSNSTAIYVDAKDYWIFDGITFSSSGRAFRVSNSDYWQVRNCTIADSGDYAAMDLNTCDYWTIEDNDFGTSTQTALQILNSDNNNVSNNIFADCGAHSCIDITEASTYNVIFDNTFKTTGVLVGEAGVDCLIQVLKGSDHNEFYGNKFFESGTNVDDDKTAAYKVQNSAYNSFHHNLVYDMDQWAGMVYSSSAEGGQPVYNVFHNNLVYDSGKHNAGLTESGAFTLYQYSGGTAVDHTDIANNVIVNHGRYVFGYSADGGIVTYITNSTFRNNLIYNTTGLEFRRASSEYTLSQVESSFSSEYFDNVEDYPRFVNVLEDDYRLKGGSPGINAGVDVGLTKDFRGVSIPQCSDPDIGAYEGEWHGYSTDNLTFGWCGY